MNNTQRLLIFAVFLAAAGFILFGPGMISGRKNMHGPMPAQNMIPDNGRPIFLEFYSRSCSICRELAPGIKKLEGEFQDRIDFVFIDTEDPRNASVVNEFKVYGLPTFFWITAEREIVDSREGYVQVKEIRKLLQELAASAGGST